MSFSRPSVKTELDRFFKAISPDPYSFSSVSKSAFSQARRKLKPEVFKHLSHLQLNYFEKHSPVKNTWKGYRLIAIDGSKLNLPYSEEIKSHFGLMKNQYRVETTGAIASLAYDVCNNLILDSKIAPNNCSEQSLALEHLSHLNPLTDILIFDRGYPAVWLMSLLNSIGFKYCIRLSTSWKDAVSLAKSNLNDIDWFKKRGTEGGAKRRFDEFKIPEKIEARLVKIILPSGEAEILATNLDREKFSVEDLKVLYHQRWGVELSVRVLKEVLEVEYFTGKTSIAVYQDFYSRVLMANTASMIANVGLHSEKEKREETTKHKLKVNITQSLAKTKDFFLNIFYSSRPRELITQMLKILSQSFEIIRPNRSFPRRKTIHLSFRKFCNNRGI